VHERISFGGLLAPILGLLERPRIRTGWPRAMDCLGALALEAYAAARDDACTALLVERWDVLVASPDAA
jgi:hypothetical protein